MSFVIHHPEFGVYLGHAFGHGFSSKLDPAGQEAACAFRTQEDATSHMATWNDRAVSAAATLVPVVPDLTSHASVGACVAAGLEPWCPNGNPVPEGTTIH